MYDSILVPTDGSDAVDRTLPHALRLAADHDATVRALAVVDIRSIQAAGTDDRDGVDAELTADAEASVAEIADRAAERDLNVETSVRHGTPDKEIIHETQEEDLDVIVIGTDSKSPREKIALGSVSERVVDSAEVPVFVVKGSENGD
ncbi:MAG: universal stress protein UspA related nucleotide-binding protein [Halonotius sp. J07HN6]|nr:MAG: universal stress protein UspA related nucleotide-binding protein [Halonotius sp. J07HN6]